MNGGGNEEEAGNLERMKRLCAVPPPPSDTINLNNNDVVCILGKIALEHPGNAAYLRLIYLSRDSFVSARSVVERLKIASSVVSAVKTSIPGAESGRFLERHFVDGEDETISSFRDATWKSIDDEQAIELTFYALGGGRDCFRREMFTPHPLASAYRRKSSAGFSPATARVSPPSAGHPSLTIKLTQEQAGTMMYPIGCPIWYNAESDSTTPHDGPKICSSLGDASIGRVKSASLDISTRKLLYVVSPMKMKVFGNENVSSSGSVVQSDGRERLFWEENLCYASRCPVLVRLGGETVEGEVLLCDGSITADSVAKKTYMVNVFLNDNKVRTLRAIDEDSLTYHHITSVPVVNVEKEAIQQNSWKEKTVSDSDDATKSNRRKPESPKTVPTGDRSNEQDVNVRHQAQSARIAAGQNELLQSDDVSSVTDCSSTSQRLRSNKVQVAEPPQSAMPKSSDRPEGEDVKSKGSSAQSLSKPANSTASFKCCNLSKQVSIGSDQNISRQEPPISSLPANDNSAHSIDNDRVHSRSLALSAVSNGTPCSSQAVQKGIHVNHSKRKRPASSALSLPKDQEVGDCVRPTSKYPKKKNDEATEKKTPDKKAPKKSSEDIRKQNASRNEKEQMQLKRSTEARTDNRKDEGRVHIERSHRGRYIDLNTFESDYVAGCFDETVVCMACGGRATVLLYENGGCAWTMGLPTRLQNALEARKRRLLSSPTYIALGSNGRFFVQYADGTMEQEGCCSKMNSHLNAPKRTVKTVAFGQHPDSYFVLFVDGYWKYNHIPKRFHRLMFQELKRKKLTCVSLGPSGEFFVREASGKVWWGGLSDENSKIVARYEDRLQFMDFGDHGSFFLRYT